MRLANVQPRGFGLALPLAGKEIDGTDGVELALQPAAAGA